MPALHDLTHLERIALDIGLVPDVTFMLKFGHNDTIGAGEETVWDGGSVTGGQANYNWLTSAVKIGVSSTDAKDTSAGVGVRTVQIYGLDSDYLDQNETITMNGQTKVESQNTYIRLHRIVSLTAGSEGDNAGDIFAYDTSSAVGGVIAGVPDDTTKIVGVVEAGEGQTQQAIYTIPANKTGLLLAEMLTSNIANTKKIESFRRVREDGGAWNTKTHAFVNGSGSSVMWINYKIPEKIPAKADIEIRAESSAAASDVAARFDLILVPNVDA